MENYKAVKINDNYNEVDYIDFGGCDTITSTNGTVIGVRGDILIKCYNDVLRIFSGEHGLNDYAKFYGFRIEFINTK